MKKNKLFKILSLGVLLVSTLFVTSCDLFTPSSKDPVSPVVVDPSPKDATYTCSFYDGEEYLGGGTVTSGGELNDPGYQDQENAEAYFHFLGWDANDDGVPETFPYIVSENTTFKVLWEKTYKEYSYKIVVNGETVKEVTDAHYLDNIEYPDTSTYSHIDAEGNVYLFLGWKYNGTFDGLTYLQVDKNETIEAYFAESQIVKLYYDGGVYANYVSADTAIDLTDTLLTDNSSITIADNLTIRWYQEDTYQTSLNLNKMPVGNVTAYGRLEMASIPTSALIVKSEQELIQEFNNLQINRKENQEFWIGFECKDLNSLVTNLINKSIQLYSYEISVNLSYLHDLFVTVKYTPITYQKTGDPIYTIAPSFNLKDNTQTRLDTYNNFACEKMREEYNCETSDALFYALENGYKPIIDSTNQSLIDLYNKMKNVLREIINDNMTDLEKALAIYEWLAKTVVYDGKLLQKVDSNQSDLASYSGFYLEGVFNDHLAVCDGFSKAYASLCNMEGIECVRVTGQIVSDTNPYNHAWNKIKIDGKWYVVDATSAGTIVGDKIEFTYSFFMISSKKYSSHAVEDNIYYSDIECNTDYDIYSILKCGDLSLKASSVEEAAKLLKYFYDNKPSNDYVFNFELGFTYSDLSETIDEILKLAGVNGVLSYAVSFDSLIVQFTK